MAPIPSASGTIRAAFDGTLDTSDTAIDNAFDAGTDADRLMVVWLTWNNTGAHTMAGVTFNGVALTAFGAVINSTACRMQGYSLVAPATGSHTLSVDPSTGSAGAPISIAAFVYSGVDQSTPFDNYTTNTGTDAAGNLDSLLTIVGQVGDLLAIHHGVHSAGVTSATATGFTERTDNIVDSAALDVGQLCGDVASAASTDTVGTWAGGFAINYGAMGININAVASGPTAALTGTAASGTTEQHVRDGGRTIILTLTGDTFVASGATFDAQRQAILDGIDSAQVEAAGWDAVVKAGLAVTAVARTSDTVVTVTLSAFATYQITATETITATIPAAALTGAVAVVASPTFSVTRGAGDLVQPVGVTNAIGVPATSSGSFTTDRAGLTRFTATVGGVALTPIVVVTAR